MKKGHLSEYFEGVAVKELSQVEANILRSHQHEFNASRKLISCWAGAKVWEDKHCHLPSSTSATTKMPGLPVKEN